MKRFSRLIHIGIMFLIMLGTGFLPPAGTITPMGMKVLGVFLGLIYAWMFVGMLWPSFAGLVALGLSGYCTVTQAFNIGFGNSTFLQIFFFFIIAAYAEHSGLSNKIALFFLSRKIIEGRPWMFVFMLFLASYILGIFIMTYAVIFFMWTILISICDIIGYRRLSKEAGYLFVGVLQMATLGGTIMPYQVFPKVCMTALAESTGLTVSSGSFIVYMTIISFAAMLLYFLGGKLIRLDLDRFNALKTDQITQGKSLTLTLEEKVAAAVLTGFTVLILLPLVLPSDSLFINIYKHLGDFGFLVASICLVCALRCNGEPLADFKKLAREGLNWDLLALVAATMAIGKALMAKETGIITTIVDVIMPLFSSMSSIMFILISFITMALLTQVAHNLVLATTFIPILANLALSLGMSEQVAIIIAAGLSQVLLAALVTPAASNRGALIYGYEWIGPKRAAHYGTLAVVAADLSVIIMGIPLAFVIF
ncbi:SLC13 family permease [Mailhella massiliensis]|uniref:Anion permease n=1 Tax=Mailhella massiliensis TaxID=1903261 RepID=A0A921AWM6_9BACT|nr:SLC13 family permease [Mailhella massiliensis]HJD97225.1 anion permease [Mailhella massiliensis]